MRLIDANKLFENSDIFTLYTKEYGSIEVIPVEQIGDAPTIEAEPVKHGRWLTWEEMFSGKTPKRKNNLGVFCDQCRNHADNMSDYCPNCGAKMDEEVDT